MKNLRNVLGMAILALGLMSMTSDEFVDKKKKDCFEFVVDATNDAFDAGFDIDTVTCIANGAYADCSETGTIGENILNCL